MLNGTGVQDQASELTDRFEELGFQVASPNSADPVWVTEVRYPPGSDAEAHLVARYLDAEPRLIPDPEISEITVVTGPELVGVLDSPRPAESVSTTTSTTSTTT
ncbi:MAG: LytR C-terminal domain-containing protein [Microthrixaceae bacterium]|nr:LytR C-terminal domain-containing protein [Microthrixaceae bacterium]